MSAPRLEIDLHKIGHNARALVHLLSKKGISVSGVTKAMLGMPAFTTALRTAGVQILADSRLQNISTMRSAGTQSPIWLIRSPMIEEVAQVVEHVDISLNTELDVIAELSKAATAAKKTHGILLMVELGDLREGIMPADLEDIVGEVLQFPNIALMGLGTNLACRSGVSPDAKNMGELTKLANATEQKFAIELPIISGGNSSNLDSILSGADVGRINNLRLGEAILLGCEPLHRQPLAGLHTDAFTLVAQTIESKLKPSQPWGTIAEAAFGAPKSDAPASLQAQGHILQSILALGHMDTDPNGLTPISNVKILGSSSDHLFVETGDALLPIGSEVRFDLNYSALVRAMASPFIEKMLLNRATAT